MRIIVLNSPPFLSDSRPWFTRFRFGSFQSKNSGVGATARVDMCVCVCEIRKEEVREGARRKRGTERLTGLLL